MTWNLGYYKIVGNLYLLIFSLLRSYRQLKILFILNLGLEEVRGRFFRVQTFISLYFRESSLLFCPFVPVVPPFTSSLSRSWCRTWQSSFSFEIVLCREGELRKCVTRRRRRHKRKKSVTSRRGTNEYGVHRNETREQKRTRNVESI